MKSMREHYDALVQWVGSEHLHPSIEIYHDDLTGGSFRVKKDHTFEPGTIVTLPLAKSLSYLNAITGHPDFITVPDVEPPPGSNYFPTSFLKTVPPHVIGRFFLIQQYLLGPSSPWAPYISSLPQPSASSFSSSSSDGPTMGQLPCTWPTEDVEFLRGTNAYVAVKGIQANLYVEYNEAISVLSGEAGEEAKKFTPELYTWAYCVFTSRSFRPSLILPNPESLNLPCKMDEFSVLLPLFDIANHSPRARTAWRTSTANELAGSPSSSCRLESSLRYGSGQQVYNNYGLKTNAELLLGYGFMLDEDEGFVNDYVHVRTKPPARAGGGGSANQDELAATHLVSLRPMMGERCLVGRSRMLIARRTKEGSKEEEVTPPVVLSCFSHVQDTLVAALLEAVGRVMGLGEEQLRGLSLEDVMKGEGIPEEVLDELINALGTKLSMDLDEIEKVDVVRPRNVNQELALRYREKCKEVLVSALDSLG